MSSDSVTERIKKTILEHSLLEGVRHLVLGFSGGPDSMCLFHVLNKLDLDIVIHPVHINHGIRKGVCDEEQEFCEKYISEQGLECRSFVVDCEGQAKEWGISTEEAGRKLRYDAFFQVADEILEKENLNNEAEGASSIVIATAQNADDQVETVLMRILRGTGVKGLSGIPYEREDVRGYKIVRPLLDVYKEDILNYCEENDLNPRIDLTNSEPIYQRNRIRLELIPYLEERYNPNIKEAVLRLVNSAIEERAFIDEEVEIIFPAIRSDSSFNNMELKKLSPVIRKAVLRKALGEIGLTEDLIGNHYSDLEKLVFTDDPSAHLDLPRGYFAERRYDELVLGSLSDKSPNVSGNQGLENPDSNCPISKNTIEIKTLEIAELNRLIADGKLKKGYYGAFDLDEIEKAHGVGSAVNIKCRNRQPGDYIKLKSGTKSIQDIFVDDKIPLKERDQAMLLALGSEVLWIVPYGKDSKRWTSQFMVSDFTKRVVLATI